MSEIAAELPWHEVGDMQSLFGPDSDSGSGEGTDGTSPSSGAPGSCAMKACRSLKVDGVQVALFNTEAGVHAIDDRCTHGNAYLSEGELDGFEIECPMHAGVFDVRTGAVLGPPATRPARCHQVRVESNGTVFIRITPRG